MSIDLVYIIINVDIHQFCLSIVLTEILHSIEDQLDYVKVRRYSLVLRINCTKINVIWCCELIVFIFTFADHIFLFA